MRTAYPSDHPFQSHRVDSRAYINTRRYLHECLQDLHYDLFWLLDTDRGRYVYVVHVRSRAEFPLLISSPRIDVG